MATHTLTTPKQNQTAATQTSQPESQPKTSEPSSPTPAAETPTAEATSTSAKAASSESQIVVENDNYRLTFSNRGAAATVEQSRDV